MRKLKFTVANGELVTEEVEPAKHVAMLPFEAKIRIGNILKEMDAMDKVFVRYVEDLVILLVRKGVIKKEELPSDIIHNTVQRQKLRQELSGLQKMHPVLS